MLLVIADETCTCRVSAFFSLFFHYRLVMLYDIGAGEDFSRRGGGVGEDGRLVHSTCTLGMHYQGAWPQNVAIWHVQWEPTVFQNFHNRNTGNTREEKLQWVVPVQNVKFAFISVIIYSLCMYIFFASPTCKSVSWSPNPSHLNLPRLWNVNYFTLR